MTMHESSYSIAKFSENISETNTIKALKTLIQGNSCLDLSVFLEANTPVSLCWDAKLDAFTGSQSFTVFPKIVINGELYESACKHDLKLPGNGFAGLELAFLKALRESIGTAQRVWH
jgi:hypothetical protein